MTRLRTTDAPPPEERKDTMPLTGDDDRHEELERQKEHDRNYRILLILGAILGGAICLTVIVISQYLASLF